MRDGLREDGFVSKGGKWKKGRPLAWAGSEFVFGLERWNDARMAVERMNRFTSGKSGWGNATIATRIDSWGD